jgi:hypothetical protein
MKEIPCYGVEVLRNTAIYPELEQYAAEFKKGATPWMIIGIVLGLPCMFITIMLYFMLHTFAAIFFIFIQGILSNLLSPILSSQITDFIGATIYWAGETMFVIPFLIITYICAGMFYHGFLRLIKKYPNVASKIIIADNKFEGPRAMCGDRITLLLFDIYKIIHDSSIGMLNPDARMDVMYWRMFPKGHHSILLCLDDGQQDYRWITRYNKKIWKLFHFACLPFTWS